MLSCNPPPRCRLNRARAVPDAQPRSIGRNNRREGLFLPAYAAAHGLRDAGALLLRASMDRRPFARCGGECRSRVGLYPGTVERGHDPGAVLVPDGGLD